MNQNYQFLAYTPGITCHTVATHFNKHPEECASYVFLKYFGDVLHPGISEAIENKSFLFVDAGCTSYLGKSWRQWHTEGVVFIGTMGSPYDEHYLPDEIRQNECSATLVARALDLTGGTFEKLFDSLLTMDRGSENNFLSFSSDLRNASLLCSYSIEDQTKLLELGMAPFERILLLQDRFCNETSAECKKNAKIEKITYKENRIVVAAIESKDPQMATVAKTKRGVSANVVICKNGNGHVFISTSGRPFVDLSWVAKNIKMEEMRIKKMRFDPQDPRLLMEGSMIGLDEWHFQKEAQRLFNGSLSAPNKKPTQIPLENIMNIVLKTLQYSRQTRSMTTAPGFEKLKTMKFEGKQKVS